MSGQPTDRLLHVLTTTQRRGAEVFATELAPALDAHGWTSSLIALASGGAGGLEVETLGDRRRGVSTLRQLRQRIRRASVVIAHGSTTLPACALAGAGTGVPLVYRSVGDPRYWAPTRGKRSRTAGLMRRASRVVALTDQAADALEAHYWLPRDRIVVIPKGVSATRLVERTATTKVEARRALDLPSDGAVALYLGALGPEKNVGMAIEAVSEVEGVVLVIAGSGPERAALEQLDRELATGRVRFLGQVSNPATALSAADLLVLPSHTEGMPGVAMEAGVVGIPVVATDVGWVRDIVIDGRTGVLSPAGDPAAFAAAIRTALEEGESMGSAARAHCLQSFDIQHVAARWSTMLSSVA